MMQRNFFMASARECGEQITKINAADARAKSGRLQHSQRGIVCSSVTLLTNYGLAHESAVKNLSTGSQFETTIDAIPLHNLKLLFPGI